MTRIVKIEKTGGPEVLKFETITIDKPGPEEVLIEHKAIGLNYIDIYINYILTMYATTRYK